MSQKVAQLLYSYMMMMSACRHWAWVLLGFHCYGFDNAGLSTHMTDIQEACPTRGLGHLQRLHAMEKTQALAAPEPLPPRRPLLCLSCQDWAPLYFHHPGCKCELRWLLEHIVARMWTVTVGLLCNSYLKCYYCNWPKIPLLSLLSPWLPCWLHCLWCIM
jgi:hypothetical protein